MKNESVKERIYKSVIFPNQERNGIEWILVLMGYIDEMVCWELKALSTDRMKFVLFVAARIGERERMENLVNPKKESGEGRFQNLKNQRERQDEERR